MAGPSPSKVADRYTLNSNTAGTTFDYVLTDLTVGNYLVIRTSADNTGGSGAARTITVTNQSGTPIDTATDLAYQQNNDPGASGAGVTCNVVVARITDTSGTVRITYSGSVTQAGVAEEWTGIHRSSPVTGTPVGANGTASTNLASCADASVAAGNLSYGAMAVEGPASDTYTQDADTTNGSWSTLTKAGTSTGTANTEVTTYGGYKVVTATGAQTYNPTINNARDSAGIIIEFATAIYVDATGSASATGTAYNASISIQPNVGSAAATGTADNGSASLATTSTTVAEATGTAYDATVETATPTNVFPTVAEATGTAYNATAALVSEWSDPASDTTDPADGTVFAGVAEATGAAYVAAASVAPNALIAESTGVANNATVSLSANAQAGVAEATGTSHTPSVSVSVNAGVATATGTSHGVSNFTGRYPASTSGRKILDQYGDPYLIKTFSSWSMAQHLTNAEITTALTDVAANGFNGVTVWIGGGYSLDGTWNTYTNAAAQNFWTGTAWASSLGAAWGSVDHIVSECARLGLVAHLSFAAGFSTTGASPEWNAVTNTNMYDAGVAIATRYTGYRNIVWHIMFDDSYTTTGTSGTRIDNLFDGINDTEGINTRIVRWVEPNNGDSTYNQFLSGTPFSYVNITVNSVYEYTGDSAVVIETGYAEAVMPLVDSEPLYDGHNYPAGNSGQQMRERNYATFIEGGVGINYGHEDWWTFGATGVGFTEGLAWTEVQAHSHTLQASYAWDLIDAHCADTTWAPTSSFITTGEGTTDAKAAQGKSDSAALAYFPDNRTIEVDTTVMTGTANVRLRWYDPTTGTFTLITASEAQQTGRSVTLPAARGDGTRDFVLVVDFLTEGTANAGLATGTGTSHQPSVSVAPNASVASSTGTADNAPITISPSPAAASATGSGHDATLLIASNATAEVATSTGAAYNVSAAILASAIVATAAGTAYDATVSTQINAQAVVAEATGTAYNPTVQTAVAAAAGEAAAAGAAHQPSASVASSAGSAVAAGTANDATVSTTDEAPADLASGSGTANNVTTTISSTPIVATGSGEAFDASVSTSAATNAQAEVAESTGTAHQPFISVAVNAGTGTATGTSYDVTASTTDDALADLATAAGTAYRVEPSVAPTSLVAASTGTAYNASVSTTDEAPADVATGTGSAEPVSATIASTAQVAAAVGTSNDATVSTTDVATAGTAESAGTAYPASINVQPSAGFGSGTGTAGDTDEAITVSPTVATGTGTGHDATVATARNALAEVATGSGTGQPVTANISASAIVATATGTANDATVQTNSNVNATAEVATGTGTAYDATTTISASTTVATGLGAADDQHDSIGASTGSASATGTAYPATPFIDVRPSVALATGTANDAGVSTIDSAQADVAQATGAAHDATVSTNSNVSASADVASGIGVAHNATATITVPSSTADGSGTAYNASVSISPSSDSATATGTANQDAPSLDVHPLVALATAAAHGAVVFTTSGTPADVAEATGTAFNATIAVSASAFAAVSSGIAHNAAPTTVQASYVILNNAQAIYLGPILVERVYHGSDQVWP